MLIVVYGPGPDGSWTISVCDDEGCLETEQKANDHSEAAALARALAAEYGCDWLEECPPPPSP